MAQTIEDVSYVIILHFMSNIKNNTFWYIFSNWVWI